MGRHERESLVSEAQRLTLISHIRDRLLAAFADDHIGFDGPAADAKLRRIARTIDGVLDDFR